MSGRAFAATPGRRAGTTNGVPAAEREGLPRSGSPVHPGPLHGRPVRGGGGGPPRAVTVTGTVTSEFR